MSSTETKRFWRKVIKNRIVLSLGNRCSICHNSYSNVVYDCHHLNPQEKDLSISSIQTNGAKTWYKIRDELKKCCLLCANCHRLVHNNEVVVEDKQYFNEDYYEWDLAEYNQISKVSMLPVDIEQDKIICPKCGGRKTSTAQYCSSCRNKEQQKAERPSREQLKKLIRTKSFTEIGRIYGVSDNAIRNWCEKSNLPRTKEIIKNYTDEEWELL